MNSIVYEPYTGEYTGSLSGFVSKETKLRYTFKAPLPRILKGQAYMVKLETATNTITLLPILRRT